MVLIQCTAPMVGTYLVFSELEKQFNKLSTHCHRASLQVCYWEGQEGHPQLEDTAGLSRA